MFYLRSVPLCTFFILINLAAYCHHVISIHFRQALAVDYETSYINVWDLVIIEKMRWMMHVELRKQMGQKTPMQRIVIEYNFQTLFKIFLNQLIHGDPDRFHQRDLNKLRNLPFFSLLRSHWTCKTSNNDCCFEQRALVCQSSGLQ